MAEVRVRLNQSGLDRLLRRPGGPVYDKVVSGPLTRTAAIAAATGPRITSHLVSNHSTEINAGPGSLSGRLTYHAHYAAAVMKGSGIYGPSNAPIRPKNGRYLRFTLPDGTLVFARSVKGQRGNPFLANAFRAACFFPVTIH